MIDRRAIALGLTAIIGAAAFTAIASDTPFETVAFDHTGTIGLEGAPGDVCPLFEPARHRLWKTKWPPEVLVTPAAGTLLGQVLRVTAHHDDGRAMIYYVYAHDPAAMAIKYLITYGEIEVQKIEIRCASGADGATEATIRTVTIGLDGPGNKAVRHYVEGGGVERRDAHWQILINDYLARQGE